MTHRDEVLAGQEALRALRDWGGAHPAPRAEMLHAVRRMAAAPIAHRGLHGRFSGRLHGRFHGDLHDAATPENSLAAAEAAIREGYAIECDVQLTADRQPVVFHDETLDRMTGETGPVGERRLDELREIRLSGTDETIPSLADFLAHVGGRAPLFIELKRQDKSVLGRAPRHSLNGVLARAAARCVGPYGGDAALMSFDPRLLMFSRAALPHRPHGIVAVGPKAANEGHVPGWQHWSGARLLHLPVTRPHFIAYEASAMPARAPARAARWLGAPLLAWTVRSQEDADRIASVTDQIIFEGFTPRQRDFTPHQTGFTPRPTPTDKKARLA